MDLLFPPVAHVVKKLRPVVRKLCPAVKKLCPAVKKLRPVVKKLALVVTRVPKDSPRCRNGVLLKNLGTGT